MDRFRHLEAGPCPLVHGSLPQPSNVFREIPAKLVLGLFLVPSKSVVSVEPSQLRLVGDIL